MLWLATYSYYSIFALMPRSIYRVFVCGNSVFILFHFSAYCSILLKSRAVPECPGHQITGYSTGRNWSATFPSVKTWWCMNYLVIVLLGQARVAIMVHACVSCRISEARTTLSITYASVHIWVDMYRKGSLPISSKFHNIT
jgi:hypothetical protein